MHAVGRWTLAVLTTIAACLVFAPVASAADATVGARDNGKTVTIAQGDRLVLRLRSCEGSCGYHWATTRRPSARVLRRVSSRLRGQVRTFTYEGRNAGTTSLRLSYQPPGRQKARQHFRLKVRVKSSRCTPPSDTPDRRGFREILRSKQAVLYEGSTRSGFSGLSTYVGCARATGRKTEIRQESNSRTGVRQEALHTSLSGRYAGWVEKTINNYMSAEPYYEAIIWDLVTGKQVVRSHAGTRLSPLGEATPPFDQVVKFALTDQGHAGWIVQRPGGKNELWVRDDSGGSARRAAEGVDPGFLVARGDGVVYRAGGQERRVDLSGAAPPLPAVVARARDNGGVANLAPGQQLSIKLRSCEGSCGYRWRTVLAPRTRVLRRTGTRYDGQTRTFNYRGVRPGLTHVRLAYQPPGRQKARRFFQITVRVARPRCQGREGAAASGPASALYYGSAGAGRDTESLLFGCLDPVGRTFELFRSESDRGFNIHGAQHAAVNGRFAAFAETFQDTRRDDPPTNTIKVHDLQTGRLFWQASVAAKAGSYPYDEVVGLGLTHLGDAAWLVRRRATTELWVRAQGETRLVDQGAIDPASFAVDGYKAYYRKGTASRTVQLPRNETEHRVGLDQNGQTIRVRRGDDVVLRLASCERRCGYGWRFVRDANANVLLNISGDYINDAVGERREFGFTALSRGTTRLRLAYVPPGQGRAAEKTLDLKVVVR